jgi:hypothetical protein
LALEPKLAQNFIPSLQIGKRLTGWLLIVICKILNNSKDLLKMRVHAMLCYRTPESFKVKFNRDVTQLETFQVESWLNYHGEKLEKRFQLSAYKMMNQLLKR